MVMKTIYELGECSLNLVKMVSKTDSLEFNTGTIMIMCLLGFLKVSSVLMLSIKCFKFKICICYIS